MLPGLYLAWSEKCGKHSPASFPHCICVPTKTFIEQFGGEGGETGIDNDFAA